jgi:hypothetical protein
MTRTCVEELLNEAKRLAKYELTASSKGEPNKIPNDNKILFWWRWIWNPCGVGGSVTIELGAKSGNFEWGPDAWCRPSTLAIIHHYRGKETRIESDQRGDSRIDCTMRPKQHLSYLLNRLSPDNVRVIET